MRFLKWKNRSLTRGLFSAGGRVLVLLLCLCFALSSYLPASADSITGTRTYNITSFDVRNANITGTQIVAGSASTFVGAPTADLYLAINVSPTIPANSLVYISLSMSNADVNFAPVCFSGGWGQQVLDCDINGDNGNYTISALYYVSGDRTSIVLYNWVQNPNFTGRIRVTAPVSGVVSTDGLSAQDISDIRFRLGQIDQWTFDSAVRLETIIPMIQDIIDAQSDAQAEQEETNDKLDREWQQEQNDRDDLTDQQQDISDDADDSAQQAETAGTTLLGAFSSFVGALTNASPTNCVIDMDMGNLDLGEVDLCQLSPPQPIPTIASIMLIAFCVPLSLATATKMINLFRSFTG